jgi:hypothetical protein
LLKQKSISPAIAYARRGNYSSILNVEHLCTTLPSQSPHPDATPDVGIVQSLANQQYRKHRGHEWNFELPPAKRQVAAPPGDKDSSEGVYLIASTM